MGGQVEPVLQRHEVAPSEAGAPSQAPVPADATVMPLDAARSPARGAAAPRPAGCGRCCRCRRRARAFTEQASRPRGAARRAGSRPPRTRRGQRPGAVHHCRRRHVAQHAAVEHQQLAPRHRVAERARRSRRRPARAAARPVGGRGGERRRPCARSASAISAMRGVPHRDSPSARAARRRQPPLAARQHQRQRPGPERVGQRARRRVEDEPLRLGHRVGSTPAAGTACRGGRPLSRASARSAVAVGAEPRPYTVSVG